jgi:hypothetical protein
MSRELTFGKDEKGSAIAADIAKALPMTTTSGMARDTPIRAIMGIKMMAATVCDMKVATVAEKNRIHSRASQEWCRGRAISENINKTNR